MTQAAQGKPNLPDIRTMLREKLTEIQTRYRVKSLWLFGSYVRGDQTESSDLDILVDYEVAPTFFQFIELEDYLTELVGVKVDLVMKKALKPRIGERVISELVTI
jgi:predicted nucleotidyltransferase